MKQRSQEVVSINQEEDGTGTSEFLNKMSLYIVEGAVLVSHRPLVSPFFVLYYCFILFMLCESAASFRDVG